MCFTLYDMKDRIFVSNSGLILKADIQAVSNKFISDGLISYRVTLHAMRFTLAIGVFILHLNVFGQLPNGSVAPDFTLTDFEGNSHHLYSYLDAGKTVYVEVFAAHCPACWNYHQTNRLKNIYIQYGPDGTDELMVLALEHDQYSDSNAFTGNHDPWVSAGDWLTGTPYPIFNVEGADRSVFSDYNVTYYPVIYKICPDRIVEQVFTSTSETALYQKVQDCQTVSLEEEVFVWQVFFDANSKEVKVKSSEEIESVKVFSISGLEVGVHQLGIDSSINVEDLKPGIYLFEFQFLENTRVEKLSIF